MTCGLFQSPVQAQDGRGGERVQRAGDRADHQGVDHRRAEEGRLHLLPGVLHGPLPARRAQDDLPEDHHRGHEAPARRLQVGWLLGVKVRDCDEKVMLKC